MEKSTKFVGVSAQVTLSRTLYIEVPEDASEEEVLEIAKKEILLPHNALEEANSVLNRVGINVSGLDLKDWDAKDLKYSIIE